jgi:hypothetical protein
MGTRTEMIYDMDGFRAWKRPVFFTRLVKRGETLPVVEEKKFDESLKGFLKVDLSRTKLLSFLSTSTK